MAAASADAIWTPGASGRAFWESLGVPGDRVFEGMYTLDYEQVARGVQEPALPAELAAELSGKFVYLFVGHFTPERRVPALVRAFLETARADSALLLIGQGPDLEEVTALARRPGGQVCVVPGVPFDHLHAYYGRADAYVHPGGEPYSLAMQEAALLGIPLVSSRSVGAAHDYLVPGVNGIWVDPGDQARARVGPARRTPARRADLGLRAGQASRGGLRRRAVLADARAVDLGLAGDECQRRQLALLIMPAPTVTPVASSMRMKEPVVRFFE